MFIAGSAMNTTSVMIIIAMADCLIIGLRKGNFGKVLVNNSEVNLNSGYKSITNSGNTYNTAVLTASIMLLATDLLIVLEAQVMKNMQ